MAMAFGCFWIIQRGERGVAAGQPWVDVAGASFLLNTGDPTQDAFAMDFEVDYGFALFGARVVAPC